MRAYASGASESIADCPDNPSWQIATNDNADQDDHVIDCWMAPVILPDSSRLITITLSGLCNSLALTTRISSGSQRVNLFLHLFDFAVLFQELIE